MPGQGAGDTGQGLWLPQHLCEQMVEHCRQMHPKEEACGFLIANAAGMVEKVYPMTNLEHNPIGYSMDPKEQLKVEKELRQHNQKIVAIYHSHTASEASPSPVDVKHAISPDISYVLVSTMNTAQPVVKSYRIDGTAITEEPVRVDAAPGIMSAPSTADVRDMTCAQALAIVAKAAAQLANGQVLEVRYNADDVKQDLLAWARERGYRVQDTSPGLLMLQRGAST